MSGSPDGAGVARGKPQVEEALLPCAFFFFCGEDKHRASPLCLLRPRVGPHLTFARCPHPMLLVGVGWPPNSPFPAASPPLQSRNAHKGGSCVSPINVIKRIKLLERESFSFSFYLIREIPTACFVQMKARLLSIVRRPREDALPFNLAR